MAIAAAAPSAPAVQASKTERADEAQPVVDEKRPLPRRKSADPRPEVSPRSDQELAAEWRGLRRDLRWDEPKPEKELQEFADWTRRYKAATPEQRRAMLPEGIQLAGVRRAFLGRLIEQNPVRALEAAVPVVVRRDMPREVADLLEEDVKGRGDLMVMGSLPAPGAKVKVPPIRRVAKIGDEQREAFVGARREGQPSRADIPMHGIALDGKMAVSDWPGRAAEPVEVADAKRTLGEDQECPTSGEETTVNNDEAVMEVAGQYRFYCAANHAMEELEALANEESDLPLGYGFVPEGRPYTEGTKRLLIYRVDFPDVPGQVVTETDLAKMVTDNQPFWEAMSYGKATWASVGQGSTVTPVIRLPSSSSQYADFITMIFAVREAAKARGYNYQDYDFDMVVTGSKPNVAFAGVAFVGAPGCWLAHSQWNIGVSTHELGHNFGLNHANSWDTTDGSTIGPGASTEYGDPYDTMGVAPNESKRHYHAQYKHYLDWLPTADVRTVTTSGTYRVFAHDLKNSTGVRGIRIPRASSVTGQQNYWITARNLFSESQNRWLANGVFLHWTGNANQRANLLDTTPGSASGKNDAALVVGRTFSDRPLGIHITPIGKGGTSPAESYDVVVNLGSFPSNRKPSLTVSASPLTAALNQQVTFTATASDLDNDSLAYYWEFSDGTFATNSPTAVKSWSNSGHQLVRCTVSDMKGGTVTSSVLVTVGNPSTFTITGRVSDENVGVEGVTITAGSRTTTTNTDGTYALVGLSTGSYTVRAASGARVYLPTGFANPVVVGPNQSNINFGAAAATPKMSAVPPLRVNQNTPIGPIAFTVSDQDTPLNALTFSATSDNVSLVAPKDVLFSGSGADRTVSVTPGTNQTGTATLKLNVSDPEGNVSTQEWIITVNAPPVITVPAIRGDEDSTFTINLRPFATDVPTPVNQLLYAVGNPVNGTVRLLPDLYTAEFIPNRDFNGTASFQVSVTDESSQPRLFLYYSFEGPDTLSDGKAADGSNFGRDGQFEAIGGGELKYGDGDVPPAHAFYHKTALQLVENGEDENGNGSAARLMRQVPTSELNFSTSAWTFAGWFQRQGNLGDDIIFHLGDGDGAGTTNQLQVVCNAGVSTVSLQRIDGSGLVNSISAPFDSAVPWHHVAVVFTPQGGGGRLEMYLNGVKAGEFQATALGLSQNAPVVFGGHNVEDSRTASWFNGKLDDLSIWSAALTAAEVQRLSSMITPHFCGLTRTATVNLTVVSQNDAPIIGTIPDQVLDEDGTLSFPFTVSDDSTPASSLIPRVATSNPALFPLSSITLGGSGGNRTLTAKPTPEASGSAVLTIIVSDGVLESRRDVPVTVRPVNDAPKIGSIADVTILEDGAAALLLFDVFDSDTPAASVVVSATSSNEVVIPDSGLIVAGSGTRRAISVAPAANASGSATITVAANDGESSATTSFNVTVRAAADAPTISAIANQTTDIGVATAPVAFTIGDAETAASALTVSAKSSNTKLLPSSGVVLGGSGENRTITLTPAAGQSGSSTVTIAVSDGTSKTTRSFTLVVEGEGNLRVLISGEGTVTKGFLGKSTRAKGQRYTIDAKPKPGYVFNGWTGGMESPDARISFEMPESLELTANFIRSPFDDLKGSWTGLITDDPATHAGTGLLSVKLGANGSFTGSVVLGGVKSALKGRLRNDGSTGELQVSPRGGSAFTLALQFGGPAGEHRMTGTITRGTSVSDLAGNRALFTAKKKAAMPLRSVPSAWLGNHTMLLEPTSSLASDGAGAGFATLKVLPTGVVRAAGKLADGTAFSYSNFLSVDGEWPVYLSLYKKAGAAGGRIKWELLPDSDLNGSLQWFKPASVSSGPAIPGWNGAMTLEVSGSRYDKPVPASKNRTAVPALPFLNQPGADPTLVSSLAMPGGQALEHSFSLSMDGKFTQTSSSPGAPALKLSLVKGTGLVKGSFTDPSGKRKVEGALLQRGNRAAGFHSGGNSAHAFSLARPE